MIQRAIEEKVLAALQWVPAVALLGPRQIGKTTLAKHLKEQLTKKVVYIDLENPDDRQKVMANALFFKENKEACVVIDEIQHMPELFPRLRYLIDEHRVPARFILLGSANPVIQQKATESLTGRIVYFELPGISFSELPPTIDLNKHWFRGGFPTPLLQEDTAIRHEWYKAFLKTFIELDLPGIGLSVPSLTLHRLITMLAHANGSLWNASNFAKSLGVSSPTIAHYRDFLEKTYFLRALPPFFTNAKKRVVKAPKVYIRDSGFLHYLSRVEDFNALLGHPVVGYSWEGYVIEQLAIHTELLSRHHTELMFYRTREGTECDLVLVRGMTPLASIEIKMDMNPKTTKGLNNAITDLGSAHNFIVIPHCDTPYRLNEKIAVTDLPGLFARLPGIVG